MKSNNTKKRGEYYAIAHCAYCGFLFVMPCLFGFAIYLWAEGGSGIFWYTIAYLSVVAAYLGYLTTLDPDAGKFGE